MISSWLCCVLSAFALPYSGVDSETDTHIGPALELVESKNYLHPKSVQRYGQTPLITAQKAMR